MTNPNTTWLPNLVGGVSIWKLAPDLNEPKFFDGRLLVPETEGSDSLPTRVAWNVAGRIPLAEARATHAAEVGAAMREFLACVERVAKEFANPQSGYYKFKSAFTVPALLATAGDAAADANYFYSPGEKKLFVVNWGASPRDLSRKEEFIYGYDDFGRFFERAAVASTMPSAAIGAVAAAGGAESAGAGASASASASGEVEAEAEEKKVEEKKKGRAWWWWVLLGVGVLAILLLIAWLLQRCGKEGAVAADAGPDAAVLVANDAAAVADAAVADAAMADDAGGVGDAGEDAGEWRDGGAVGLADGGVRVRLIGKGGKEKIIVVPGGGGSGGGGGGAGGGKGSGGGGAGEGGDDKGLPHRSHFQPDAVRWRVSGGVDQLDPQSPRTGEGATFDVTLRPGGSFGSVKVQWQDKNGRWHN